MIRKTRNYLIFKWYDFLARFRTKNLEIDTEADFIVSIASYPKRDDLLPAVFEALDRQTVNPRKWILVLSEENYRNGIPKHLEKLRKRGVEILWVKDNSFAVKKLIPTMQKYPNDAIITFDDELIYGKKVIERLIIASKKYPGTIIGHVGKEMLKKGNKLNFLYRSKRSANPITPSDQVYFLGGSGTLYPPNSLDDRAFNNRAIHKIVPGRGSDIWFWASAHAKGTNQFCLGSKKGLSLYFSIPLKDKTTPLDKPGKQVMESRFQMAIDYFGIREKLLRDLPDQETR